MHKIALVLAIAAVGEGAVTLHLVRQLHLERENAQTLQARVTELERAPPRPQAGATFVAVPQPTVSPFTVGRKTAPADSPPVIRGTLSAVNTFVTGAAAPPLDQAQMREQINASMERQRALLRDPEYREAMIAQQKMMLMRSNASVAKDLDLTPEQVDRLFGTIAEQSLRGMENADATLWSEQPADAAKMQEAQRKATAQYNANEAELKAVLGETKYREWQEYQNLGGVRWEADRLRTVLASAGVPLDENLAKPMMKALQEQQKQMLQQVTSAGLATAHFAPASGFVAEVGGNNAVQIQENSLDHMARNLRKQRDALAGMLTPEQLKAIEDEHTTQLQMQRLQLRLMQAQQAAGGIDPAQSLNSIGYAEQGVTIALPVSD